MVIPKSNLQFRQTAIKWRDSQSPFIDESWPLLYNRFFVISDIRVHMHYWLFPSWILKTANMIAS